MREGDKDLELVSSEDQQKIMNRHLRTWGGLIIASGAIVFAFIHPETYKESFITGLIGAGILDPSLVWNSTVKKILP